MLTKEQLGDLVNNSQSDCVLLAQAKNQLAMGRLDMAKDTLNTLQACLDDSFVTLYAAYEHSPDPVDAIATYEMYSDEGNEWVQKNLIDPALDEIANSAGLNPCYRLARFVEITMGDCPYREIGDTATREAIYGTVGKALIEAGYPVDQYNWND